MRPLFGAAIAILLVACHSSGVEVDEAKLAQFEKGKTTYPPNLYGTHSLRRTKATLIYRRTRNLRAVQLLLGRMKIESTVRYLASS